MATLEAKQPLDLATLSAQSDLSPNEVKQVVESLSQQGRIIGVGQGERRLLLTAPGWEQLAKKATTMLQDYHRRFPARPGMPKVELISRLKMGAHSSAILQRLVDEDSFTEEGNIIRLTAHRIRLTPTQQAIIDTFLKSLAQNPYAPPNDLIPEPDLLNLLIDQHQVVKVSEDIIFSTSAYDEMLAKVIDCLKANGKVTLAEVRDMFHTSRKYAQALMEHMDKIKITRRTGDERVLYQP